MKYLHLLIFILFVSLIGVAINPATTLASKTSGSISVPEYSKRTHCFFYTLNGSFFQRASLFKNGVEITDGASVASGDILSLAPLFNDNDVQWFVSGGILDSPYGHWVSGAGLGGVDYWRTACNGYNDRIYLGLSLAPTTPSYTFNGPCVQSGSTCKVNGGGTIVATISFPTTPYSYYQGYQNVGDSFAFTGIVDGDVSIVSAGSTSSANIAFSVTAVAPITFPTATITASPSTITQGGSSTLTVTGNNGATGCWLSGGGLSQWISPSSGTKFVTLAYTTSYSTYCWNGSGNGLSVSATVMVNTPAVPTATITASPSTITQGGSSTLTVTGNNGATGCWLSGGGLSQWISPSSGTKFVTLAYTTSYSTYCWNGSGNGLSVSATVMVNTPAVPTATITASPSTITQGGSSTLTVTGNNGATGCWLSGGGLSQWISPSSGTKFVTPASTTSYSTYCWNVSGNHGPSVSATVMVNIPTPTVDLKINNKDDLLSEDTTLGTPLSITWTSTNTLSCTAKQGYGFNDPIGTNSGTPIITQAVFSTSPYKIECTGLDRTKVSDEVSVTLVCAIPCNTNWSACSKACGTGVQSRTCTSSTCDSYTERQSCNTNACNQSSWREVAPEW